MPRSDSGKSNYHSLARLSRVRRSKINSAGECIPVRYNRCKQVSLLAVKAARQMGAGVMIIQLNRIYVPPVSTRFVPISRCYRLRCCATKSRGYPITSNFRSHRGHKRVDTIAAFETALPGQRREKPGAHFHETLIQTCASYASGIDIGGNS